MSSTKLKINMKNLPEVFISRKRYNLICGGKCSQKPVIPWEFGKSRGPHPVPARRDHKVKVKDNIDKAEEKLH